MIQAWSADDVRAAEGAAMATLPDGELMARAAAGLAEVITARLPRTKRNRVVALVGAANNGGDALFAVAALDRATVTVIRTADAIHEPALAAAVRAGADIVDATDSVGLAVAKARLADADVVIDGILGIGGRPGLRSPAAELVDAIADTAYVIACDLPSGTDPAGEVIADSVHADETVTFGVPKPVHLLAGSRACGLLTVVDIGLDLDGYRPAAEQLEYDDVAGLWPVPGPEDDKYSRGVLGLIAGSEPYPGAAVLAATAAVSAGVGMLRYVGPPAPAGLVRAAVPEAVHGPGRVQAYAVGSGVDPTERTKAGQAQRQAIQEALADDLPMLVDAGALSLLEGPRAAPTLITPHAGELATLLGRLTGEDIQRAAVTERPIEHARRAADLLGATVLLKGATTYVVAPGDEIAIRAQSDAPAWLGTAGSGDVLAGLAGVLLAAGLSPRDAGSLAALVHGVAGHRANPGGPVRALQVAGAIGATVAGLLARRP